MQKPLDRELLVLLYDVARLMRTHADQRARAHGMTRAQWILLAWLEREPGVTQAEMAALIEVEPITVGRLVDRLEMRGLVERRADRTDRRLRRLYLTPAAEPVLRELTAYRSELNTILRKGVDSETVAEMIEGLLQMKANLLSEERMSGRTGHVMGDRLVGEAL